MEKVKDKYRVRDCNLRRELKVWWAACLGCPLEEAHSDIQAVHSAGLAGYIIKELKKIGSCEEALKRYDRGEATEGDEQKILVFYMALVERMRLLRVSRGLGVRKEETDLILYSNKLSKVRILLTRSYILKLIAWKDISPYSGALEKGMAEYRAYNKLFENQEKVIRAYSKLKSSSIL
ncbi:hypothetical protein Holit_02807 [Hollandina sp. SP2]